MYLCPLTNKKYGNPPVEVWLDHTREERKVMTLLLTKADPNGCYMHSVGQTWFAPRKRQTKVNTSLEKRNFWERSNSLWL